MKKVLTLVLSVLLVATLFSACGSSAPATSSSAAPATNDPAPAANDPAPAPAPEATAEEVTLKVWESEGKESEFLTWAMDEFTKEHPNVKFQYEPVGHTDSTQKILLDGPAGVGPDLYALPHDMLGSNVAGGSVLANPSPDYVKSSFVDAAVTGATYDGTIYGYPVAIETYALFYNKDLIPTAPKSWDEVVEFAKTYNDPKSNKYAIVWETGNAYFDYIFFSGYGSSLFGPKGDDRAQHNINSANTLKSVEYFKGLRSILDVPAGDLSGDFCNGAFENGLAAMYIVGPWRIADCKDAGLNFGITTLPAFPGESNPPASFSGVRLMCISAYSEHPAEAAAFAEFLTSKDVILKRFEYTGQIPARNDVTVSDEYSAGVMAQAAYAFPMPSIPEMGQYWQTMGAAYANIWNGSDPKTELDAAAAVVEASFQ